MWNESGKFDNNSRIVASSNGQLKSWNCAHLRIWRCMGRRMSSNVFIASIRNRKNLCLLNIISFNFTVISLTMPPNSRLFGHAPSNWKWPRAEWTFAITLFHICICKKPTFGEYWLPPNKPWKADRCGNNSFIHPLLGAHSSSTGICALWNSFTTWNVKSRTWKPLMDLVGNPAFRWSANAGVWWMPLPRTHPSLCLSGIKYDFCFMGVLRWPVLDCKHRCLLPQIHTMTREIKKNFKNFRGI